MMPANKQQEDTEGEAACHVTFSIVHQHETSNLKALSFVAGMEDRDGPVYTASSKPTLQAGFSLWVWGTGQQAQL